MYQKAHLANLWATQNIVKVREFSTIEVNFDVIIVIILMASYQIIVSCCSNRRFGQSVAHYDQKHLPDHTFCLPRAVASLSSIVYQSHDTLHEMICFLDSDFPVLCWTYLNESFKGLANCLLHLLFCFLLLLFCVP